MRPKERRARMARRLAVVAVLGVVAVLAPAPPASATEPAGSIGAPLLDPTTLEYGRLRVTMVANSGWAMATFSNLEIIDYRDTVGTISYTANTMAYTSGTGGPVTRSAELLVATPIGSTITVTTTKGDAGSFRFDLDSVSPGGVATGVVDVTNTLIGQANQNAQTTTINRATLLTDEVDVGPMDEERLVLAAVHPWYFGNESFGPDQPDGPWTFDEPSDVEANVELMADAGIDVVAYSYGWPGHAADAKVDNLLDAVEADGRMRVAPLVEMDGSVRTCTLLQLLQGCVPGFNSSDLRAVVDAVADDAAAYPGMFLERDDRPVLFFYGDERLVDTNTWNSLVAAFASDGNEVFAMTQATDPARTSEGYWGYIGPANHSETAYTTWSRTRTHQARLRPLIEPSGQQRLITGTVWPGYDDTWIASRSPNFRSEARAGGDFYDSRWVAARRGLPDWVMVTSWNEWYEQTHIAPSVNAGTTALEQTEDWAAAFHS